MPTYEYECHSCGRFFSLLFRSYASVPDEPRCKYCESMELERLVSRPGLIRVSGESDSSGPLRRVDPRKAADNISRQYDTLGIDTGKGFEEVSRRIQAGDDPSTLKEAIKEARSNETQDKSAGDKPKGT